MTITDGRPELSTLAQQYAENGFVLVKGLLSKDEAAYYRQRSHDLLAQLNRHDDPTWKSAMGLADGATRLQHLHDAQFYDAEFSKLLVDSRFTDVAAAVMGVDNVQLHHTKLFVKPPENGSPFPLHQDHPFFPHTYHRVGAAIFHFDDAPEEKGCVRVIPGSHKDGPREHSPEGSYHLLEPSFDVGDLRTRSDSPEVEGRWGTGVFLLQCPSHRREQRPLPPRLRLVGHLAAPPLRRRVAVQVRAIRVLRDQRQVVAAPETTYQLPRFDPAAASRHLPLQDWLRAVADDAAGHVLAEVRHPQPDRW